MSIFIVNGLLLFGLICSSLSADPSIRFLLNDETHQGILNRIYVSATNASAVDVQKQTVFVVHGFIESANAYYFDSISKEYLKKGNYNIIGMDWSILAGNLNYIQSADNTKIAGETLGEFIVALNSLGLDLLKVHIVGHSLGSHVAGCAGAYIKNKLNALVGEIIGLDPAGPGFYNYFKANRDASRLSSKDARSVVVLHTDRGGFGLNDHIGTVEFYANSGSAVQPGCGLLDILNYSPLEFVFCSHQMSVRYFIESINTTNFVATCIDPNVCGVSRYTFGADVPANAVGEYMFNTNANRPFGKGAIDDTVMFTLYTPNNAPHAFTAPLRLSGNPCNNEVMPNLPFFNVGKDTYLVIHGWKDAFDGEEKEFPFLVDELVKQGYNVITCDWRALSDMDYITNVVKNIKIVGYRVADLIMGLNSFGYGPDRIHIAGHSLGSHVAGISGKQIKQCNVNLKRIFGLDVAMPLFNPTKYFPTDTQLAVGDADQVIVLHTDGFKLGMGLSVGDVDFYVNGGIAPQPHCATLEEMSIKCSHMSAIRYLGMSINSTQYISRRCLYYAKLLDFCTSVTCDPEQTIFGLNTPTNVTGNFYFETNINYTWRTSDEF